MPVMLKRLTMTGSTLRIRSTEDKAAIANALYEKVWPLIAAGDVATANCSKPLHWKMPPRPMH